MASTNLGSPSCTKSLIFVDNEHLEAKKTGVTEKVFAPLDSAQDDGPKDFGSNNTTSIVKSGSRANRLSVFHWIFFQKWKRNSKP